MSGTRKPTGDEHLWKEGQHIFHAFCFFYVLLAVGLIWSAWAEAADQPVVEVQAVAEPHARISMDDVQSGELLFRTGLPNEFRPAVLLNTDVRIRAFGLIATVEVTQEFRNDSRDWVEGVYVFPLPETAAVYGLRMQVGERVIVGEVQEKSQAKAAYQQAKDNGQRAVLVEQQRPNLFTNNIANIGPGESIRVTIEYLQDIDYQHGRFALSFPLTITPRYMPGQPQLDPERGEQLRTAWNGQGQGQVQVNVMGWAVNTDQVPDAEKISPFTVPARIMDPRSHRVSISAQIEPGMTLAEIESSSHGIEWQANGATYEVKLMQDEVVMDRDFVLSWVPGVGQAPEAALFSETVNGETFALLMMLPPQQVPAELALPRETIWVVDTSGSMEGVSIAQARMALLQALDTLTPKDRFNIIQFNSYTQSLFPQAVPASAYNLEQARKYAQSLRADGGTEMAAAIDAALSEQAPAGYVRQVVFLTDGSVGNEQALFGQIQSQLGDSRLFTVGIGPAPNGYFMRKASQFGRGTSTMISSGSEVVEKMEKLISELKTPVMRDVRVQWPQGLKADQVPETIPDLYHGKPLMALVKLTGSTGDIKIDGYQAGQVRDSQPLWSRTLKLDDAAHGKGLARYWARHKIEQLLDQKVTGTPEDDLRDAVLSLALEHQLVSPYTSLVAVDKTPARPLDEELSQASVASLLPAGISENMVMLPRTATSSQLHLMLGSALLVLAVLLWAWGDREGRSVAGVSS